MTTGFKTVITQRAAAAVTAAPARARRPRLERQPDCARPKSARHATPAAPEPHTRKHRPE
jgi:hypothetical protein